MKQMFFHAGSFSHQLCTAAWVYSKADKQYMFLGSRGSIAETACEPSEFLSNTELEAMVRECLKNSPAGDCPDGPYGHIGDWPVSRVTDMHNVFYHASQFNADISTWDVSSVTTMCGMFRNAELFECDLSKWDVSSTKDMSTMFRAASMFNSDLSKWDVSSIFNMFALFNKATQFNGDISTWDVSSVVNMGYMFRDARSFLSLIHI